ncbi:putative transcriptional regulator [Microbacteriaceae bacterium MWH-Ta3]|nr:putative transcriptional regulator [Microbacteriaceae bacterium MWH-Ta3]
MTNTRSRGHGELESLVLRIVREADRPLTAAEIRLCCTEPLPAHTTVLTALERLRVKGDIVRVGDASRSITFTATRSTDESAVDTILEALDSSQSRGDVLMKFAGSLSADDVELLRIAMGKISY